MFKKNEKTTDYGTFELRADPLTNIPKEKTVKISPAKIIDIIGMFLTPMNTLSDAAEVLEETFGENDNDKKNLNSLL